MDIWSIIMIAARRWYVTLPALLIVGLVVVRVADTVRPTAQATGTLALLSPSSVPAEDSPNADQEGNAGDGESEPELVPVNPYLYFSSSLMSVADILRQTADASEFRRTMQDQGLDAQYEIGVERTSPVVAVSSQAEDPSVAVETVEELVNELADELQSMQEEAGAPAHTWIQTQVVSQSQEAQLLQTNRLRVIASVAGLGFVAAIALALVVETATAALRRQRTGSAARGNGSGSVAPHRTRRFTTGGSASAGVGPPSGLIGASRRRGGGYGALRQTDE